MKILLGKCSLNAQLMLRSPFSMLWINEFLFHHARNIAKIENFHFIFLLTFRCFYHSPMLFSSLFCSNMVRSRRFQLFSIPFSFGRSHIRSWTLECKKVVMEIFFDDFLFLCMFFVFHFCLFHFMHNRLEENEEKNYMHD